jgi:hypothetical protein
LAQHGDDPRRSTVIVVTSVFDGDEKDEITDDELTRLALEADPDRPVDPDAIPISRCIDAPLALLPDWYMPATMSAGRGAARRWLLGGIVLVLVVINGVGLCVTYGVPEIAW